MRKDSALEKWKYREHTRVKHILLKKYLEVWTTVLGKWNPRICYFDGFAGRGEYADGTLGSPLIALEVADSLSHRFGELVCFFVERDLDNYRNLESVLEREKPKVSNWRKIKVHNVNAEFAEVIDGLLEGLEKKKGTLAPSFFFIDPFGFSGVPFTVIRKILVIPKTEVFFTFMTRDMARFFKLPQLEDVFDKLFGTPKWKGMIGASREPGFALVNLYRKQLHEVGNVRYSWPFRVSTSQKLQTLYYLLHVTNNLTGHLVMKSIMYNQSAQGNFAYLGPGEVAARTQMRLFDIDSIQDLKEYLLKRFRGKTYTYTRIQERVCTPWHTEPPYVDKHYRQCLKELEREREVEVDRVTSKTKRGLGGEDRVTFLQDDTPALLRCPHSPTRLKVHRKEYPLLDGTKRVLVERVNDGSIITRFDKTPLPRRKNDIICPHFLELKWAYGCPYDCAWCYLKGTFRFRPGGPSPVVKDYDKIELHTGAFLEGCEIPEILNTGEIADSLMAENRDRPFSTFIIPMFESQRKHKVLLLTKSTEIRNLLQLDSHGQVIMSFSLNAVPVGDKWEKAPKTTRRLEAAHALYKKGFEVRVRIDPMVPIGNWEGHYLELVDRIFERLIPERITLGSLRGLQSTINGCTDRSWVRYLSEGSNWGRRIDKRLRHRMYRTIIEYLKENHTYSSVALCKESLEMWEMLQMDTKQIRCNCVW